MRTAIIVVIALLAAAALAAPVVHAPSGTYSGVTANKTDRFLGIRYALPPTGPNRWMPPRPAPVVTDTVEVTEFGASCMQNGSMTFRKEFKVSEDCLFLNVWRPEGISSTAKLPVLVWIYGGNYVAGTSTIYPLADMVSQASQPFVAVSLNYRVNIFGFAVADTGTYNYGLMDQQLALQWVQDNIKAFGGDASRVTIFGESAGGNSVSMHLLMPRSYSLYDRAILESPAPWIFDNTTVAKSKFTAVEQVLGCVGSSAMSCMRSKSAFDVYNALSATHLLFQPVVGDPQLPLEPYVMWDQGKVNPTAAILVGNNEQEGNIFAYKAAGGQLTMPREVFDAIAAAQEQQLGAKAVEQIKKEYSSLLSAGHYFEAVAHIVRDVGIICGERKVAQVAAARPGASTYRFIFTHASEHWFYTPLNATHTAEIPYVQNTEDLLGITFTDEERGLAQEMSDAWVSFAYDGRPNGTYWVPYVEGTASIMYLDINPHIGLENSIYDNCPFWDKLMLEVFNGV